MQISRRRALQLGIGTGAALALGPDLAWRAAATPPAPGGFGAVEHIVFLMQENRSFDHYFGTLGGVRGFDDRSLGAAVFSQKWPGGAKSHLLPFHLDTSTTAGAWVNDIDHSWGGQHQFWNKGRMDQWVVGHLQRDGAKVGTAAMGYYRREDLPFYYALADAFTICDNYHCATMTCTEPNRLYSMTATIDPSGRHGGPVTSNPTATAGVSGAILSWTTMPERLQAHGVSWKIYDTPPTGISTNVSNNVMPLFKQYQDPSSELFRNAMLPSWPGEFELDCLTGTLPQVSWVLAPPGFDEHPPAPSGFGEFVAARVLSALTSNPSLWSKTALFITYDEQGGFFDHVTPPTPPPGMPDEYLHGLPIGLGYRVPMLVVSPFSRGGYVCSELFDHTSMLRLLERRYGVEVPNLSKWRRSAVGDLTHTLGTSLDASQPVPAPTTLPPVPAVLEAPFVFPSELDGTPTPPYPVPSTQKMPTQEPGRRKRRP